MTFDAESSELKLAKIFGATDCKHSLSLGKRWFQAATIRCSIFSVAIGYLHNEDRYFVAQALFLIGYFIQAVRIF